MSLFDLGSNLLNLSKGQIGKLAEELTKNGGMHTEDIQGLLNNLIQKDKNKRRNKKFS